MIPDPSIREHDAPHDLRKHRALPDVQPFPDDLGELEVVDGPSTFPFGERDQLGDGRGLEAEVPAEGCLEVLALRGGADPAEGDGAPFAA